MRYIVSIMPLGERFMNVIQDLDLGNNYVTDHTKPRSEIDVITAQQYIFRESIVQITNVLSPDLTVFLREIQRLPDLKYFKQIGELMDHGPRRVAFENHFREFAFHFLTIVAKYIPLRLDKDYIVDGVHHSYVVIREADKPQMLDIL